MPTQKPRKRIRDELQSLAGFPPEGIREPFKTTELTWTQRFPMGTGGMNSYAPRDQIQPDEAWTITNLVPKPEGLHIVRGYSEIGNISTIDNILALAWYLENDGTSRIVGITYRNLHHYDGSSWSAAIGGGGAAMTGTATDWIRADMVLDRLIWVNGVDAPKTWRVGDATYANLTADANAPDAARHVAAFADRVVFADITEGGVRNMQRIEWSASGDPTNFTSTGSGGTSLQDTTDDSAADPITGLKVFDDFLVVFRSRSIWVGQRTGISTAPIRFYPVVQGIGCNAPDSIQVCGDLGLVFLSDDNIYLYNPSSRQLLPVGNPIKSIIYRYGEHFSQDHYLAPEYIQYTRSAYVADTKEYYLFYSIDNGINEPVHAAVLDCGRLKDEGRPVWYRRDYDSERISAAIGCQVDNVGAAAYEWRRHQLVFWNITLGGVYTSDPLDTTDAGAAISWTYESPDFTAGSRLIDMRRITLSYVTATGGLSATLVPRTDGVLGSSQTVSLERAASPFDKVVLRGSFWFSPGESTGRVVSFRLTGSGMSGLRLVGYEIGFTARGEITTTFSPT